MSGRYVIGSLFLETGPEKARLYFAKWGYSRASTDSRGSTYLTS